MADRERFRVVEDVEGLALIKRVAVSMMLVMTNLDERRAQDWAARLLRRGYSPKEIDEAAERCPVTSWQELVATIERLTQRRRLEAQGQEHVRRIDEAEANARRLPSFAGLRSVKELVLELWKDIREGRVPAKDFDAEFERRRRDSR